VFQQQDDPPAPPTANSFPLPVTTDASIAIDPPDPPPDAPLQLAVPALPFTLIVPFRANIELAVEFTISAIALPPAPPPTDHPTPPDPIAVGHWNVVHGTIAVPPALDVPPAPPRDPPDPALPIEHAPALEPYPPPFPLITAPDAIEIVELAVMFRGPENVNDVVPCIKNCVICIAVPTVDVTDSVDDSIITKGPASATLETLENTMRLVSLSSTCVRLYDPGAEPSVYPTDCSTRAPPDDTDKFVAPYRPPPTVSVTPLTTTDGGVVSVPPEFITMFAPFNSSDGDM